MKWNQIKKASYILFILIFIVGIFPFGKKEPIKFVDRETGLVLEEKVPGERWLVWLYQNPIGEATMFTLVKRKFLSEIYGYLMSSPDSKSKIEPFVEEYHIDLSITEKQEFDSFNDFFIRKLKPEARPINGDSNVVVSPADGKVLAYDNMENQDFIIKGYRFNIFEFLQNDTLAHQFKDGSLMIIRLCPSDYHRYHFPVEGLVTSEKLIYGDYYSVSPIALKEKIELLVLNKRGYCTIQTKEFGTVIMSEVAATMVGSMVDTYESLLVEKGMEKGFFKFGGSTIILFFQKKVLQIDDDLLKNTINGLETTLKMGEQIGVKINK